MTPPPEFKSTQDVSSKKPPPATVIVTEDGALRTVPQGKTAVAGQVMVGGVKSTAEIWVVMFPTNVLNPSDTR
jgi:hypothetical protein